MGSSAPVIDTPNSGIFNYDKEKEKIFLNSIGKVDFKELFMESLSPEFLKLFQENINLFYSQPFYEGIGYEYGLFGKSKSTSKAYKIYKDAADFKYDYLCMYRMHRIFLTDYEEFGVKKNEDLHRLYLYKCFAYLPYSIIDRTYYLLNKIDVNYEVAVMTDELDNSEFKIFDQFMNFLNNNKNEFNITGNDIRLMKCAFKGYFSSDLIQKDIKIINEMLQFEKGDNAYYEAQLKYCNFYLEYSGDKCDKEKIKNIFDNLIKAGYYKACLDYGIFLIKEKQYDEAKKILKKCFDNNQQFCLSEYTYLYLKESNFNQTLKDFKFASYILKNISLVVCFDKLDKSSFFYMVNYLAKHSSFKQKILDNFSKYALEIFKANEKKFENEDDESIEKNFAEKYVIDFYRLFGTLCYYDIPDTVKSDKERALIYFKKSYKLAKEKNYGFYKRISYLYIYKCRKYLFKNNKISLRKLNKTKEKLFRLYEEFNIDDLGVIELYNYYKLYKVCVYGNTQNKLISLLKKGKNVNIIYHFNAYVYMEKCKRALEIEYSSNSSLNQNNIILKNEDYNKDDINLYFKAMEGQQYNLRVPKNIQFIIAIHKLYTKYPELEVKKTGTYVSNGNKINIFDTIQDNGLENGNIIIIIINKVD